MNIRSIIFLAAALTVITSCTPDAIVEEKKVPVARPQQTITDSTSFSNDILAFDDAMGPLGVYDVPEMLVLSVLDSAAGKDIASGLEKNYAILEEDLADIGAEMNGPIGMISYTNNEKNFVFETVLCIKRMPAKQPKRSKIVILEASKMLVFNFYGSYGNLFAAYDKIKRYCEKNDLIQTGPIREFYITDPEKEKDPKKWLTRIMLPVISMH